MPHQAGKSKDQILVFSCSGGSDVGELSDRIARKISRSGKGAMYCLAGVGGNVPQILATIKMTKKIVVIDGCPKRCARKSLENYGFKTIHFCLEDMGFRKGKVNVNDRTVDFVIDHIGF